MQKTVRVLIALDVPLAQVAEAHEVAVKDITPAMIADLRDSVMARVSTEAGYYDDGGAVEPTAVYIATTSDDTDLSDEETTLQGIYEVGAGL